LGRSTDPVQTSVGKKKGTIREKSVWDKVLKTGLKREISKEDH